MDTSKEVREISKAMFGINHRYHNNAYSSWNASEKKVEAKFNEYVKEAHFGSVRYPGGTVSNLFSFAALQVRCCVSSQTDWIPFHLDNVQNQNVLLLR